MADRDPKTGQFLPGNTGNPRGRPPGNPWLAALKAAATPERWRAIVANLLDRAEEGDPVAVKTVFRYLIPSPATVGQPLTGDLAGDLAAVKASLAAGELDPATAQALTRLTALELALQKATEGGTVSAEDVVRMINEAFGNGQWRFTFPGADK